MHPPKLHASTLDLPFPAPPPLAHAGLAFEADDDAAEHDARAPETPLAGALTFASPEAQLQLAAELLGAGAIVVLVTPPAITLRGKLAERLDDLVERELAARGAPSPFLSEWSTMPDDIEARLADQLFRARTVGASGIAVALGSLRALAQRGVLTPEDSTLLRVLAGATKTAPLVVMVDDGDTRLGAHGPLLELGILLGAPNALPIPDVTEDLGREELDEDEHADEGPELTETVVDACVAAIARDEITADAEQPEAPEMVTVTAQRRATAGVPVSGPSDRWRSWAIALGAARGPQPLAAFEHLFIESYVPLANAIARGVDDPRALRAHDEFRLGFEHSYADAFATFGATARRPRLVMDAFDVATKQARLHNARTTHVLVVDSMRYDLGAIVRDRLAERAPGLASLTSESLLWSALPTTTFRQLETLARGMDALRAPAADEGVDSLRGLRAETVRRLRVGSRELYKLDVIPGLLEGLAAPTSTAHVLAALDGIAEHVAEGLAHHMATLPPRTLLLVLGDHGFCVDRRGQITSGGASPEEVLVPCFAYLVADLH